jgi:magnesium chelatase family protein
VHLGRISGPLLDRIDLHIEVPTVPFRYISSNQEPAESSAEIRKRVIAARQRQIERFKQSPNIRSNARMGSRELKNFCNLNADCLNLLKMAMNELQLSARAYDRIRKVARTIADLDNSDEIQTQHIMEASQYRNLDGKSGALYPETSATGAKIENEIIQYIPPGGIPLLSAGR